MKLLIVLGEGGHTKEMLKLVDQVGDEFEYSYLLVQGDPVSQGKIRRLGPVYRARRPRDKTHSLAVDVLKTVQCCLHCWRAMCQVRPDAVVSCGPAIGAPACLMAKLFRAKVIFVETGSRVKKLSLTGRLVYPFADLFLVQWPGLAKRHRKAEFAGRFW